MASNKRSRKQDSYSSSFGDRRQFADDLGPEEKKRKHRIGYRRLEAISKGSARDAAMSCSQPNFLLLLSDEEVANKKDWIDLILVSIDLSLKADNSMSPIKDNLMACLLSDHILFLKETCLGRIEEDLTESCNPNNSLVKTLTCYLQIYRKLCSADPLTNKNLLRSLELIWFKLKDVKSDKTSELITDYSSAVQAAKKKETAKKVQTGNTRGDRICTTDRPTEDFRLIKPYPTVEDINSTEKVKLRENKQSGRFEDVDDYLDLQYRLLREDFVSTIRGGVRTVRKKSGLARQGLLKTGGDFKFYNNFWIEGLDVSNSGMCYILRVDATHRAFESEKWLKSKRFTYGSLICLSTSCFRDNDILFATIASRGRAEEKEPQHASHQQKDKCEWQTIKIKFLPESLKAYTDMNSPAGPFNVVESSAFFESYSHVLKGLKEFGEFNLPMQGYIVRSETEIEKPEYLRDFELFYHFLPQSHETGKSMSSMSDFSTWPTADDLKLNQSQYEAFKAALTQEFAIIQGPPGTGKTYVGLKIVQTLLGNLYNIGRYSNYELHNRRTPSSKAILSKCSGFGAFKVDHRPLQRNVTRLLKNRRTLSKPAVCGAATLYSGKCNGFEAEAAAEEESAKNNEITSPMHDQKAPADPMQNKNAATEDLRPLQPDLMTRPILVVCYTNHALDQFLEGILDLDINPGQLVRVGNRSKSERLKNCNMHNFRRLRGGGEHWKFQKHMKSQKDAIKRECEQLSNVSEELRVGSFDFRVEQFISNHGFWSQLKNLDHWLFEGEAEEVNSEIHRFYEWQCSRISESKVAKSSNGTPVLPKVATTTSGGGYVEELEEEYKEGELKIEGLDPSHEEQASAGWSLNIGLMQQAQSILDERVMSLEEVKSLEDNNFDLRHLPLHHRWRLFRYWVHNYERRSKMALQKHYNKLNNCIAMDEASRRQTDIDILKEAKVIGMTTTAAARLQSVLQAVGPEIVVVEEAAEVLEAHIITALSSHCKHLILIGDHKQLKPNPAVNELAKRYHLDLSLFERMVNNGLPVSTLDIQHRMRPEISKYIRGHIYENLEDHNFVLNREPIRGVSSSVFFLNHSNPESENVGMMSKCNEFEANMITKFARYLIRQGYHSEQLTVITMYKGQELLIKKKIRGLGEFEGLKVSSVDNFQGEENDIIFISLVRSNTEKKLGFIEIENRVCVTMSRAKLGMYVFGNFDMIANKSEIWAKMITEAKAAGEYGTEINLSCARHQKAATVSTPEEFDTKAPQGGCTEPCNQTLMCGHICTWKCHYGNHADFVCQRKCTRTCKSGHPCKGKCGYPCGLCHESCTKVLSICSHECTEPCHRWGGFLEPSCKLKCSKILDCGHTCKNLCSKPCGLCHEEIEKLCSRCGEIQKVQCSTLFQCKTPCKGQLDCGHVCKGTCFSCSTEEGTVHEMCTEICNKHLPCGHKCKGLCGNCKEKEKCCSENNESWMLSSTEEETAHQICIEVCNKYLPCGHRCKDQCGVCREGGCSSECYEKCLLRCSHGTQCSERCNEVCKFEEKLSRCQWGCQRHTTKCTTICGQICTFTKCGRSCRKDVKCLICNWRQECRGLCGQRCPLLCKKCKLLDIEKKVRKLSAPVCTIGRETKWLLLEDCHHIISVDYMDRWVDAHKHKLPILCPFDDCKKPVLNTARYVSITRQHKWILDEKRRPSQTDSSQRSSQEFRGWRNQETGTFYESRHSAHDNNRRSGRGQKTQQSGGRWKGFTSSGSRDQYRVGPARREELDTSSGFLPHRPYPLHHHWERPYEGR